MSLYHSILTSILVVYEFKFKFFPACLYEVAKDPLNKWNCLNVKYIASGMLNKMVETMIPLLACN